MIHSVGMRQASHVGQASGPTDGTYAVGVAGQQSVVHGTVVLDTLMYMGQIRSVGGAGQASGGQAAGGRERAGGVDVSLVYFKGGG